LSTFERSGFLADHAQNKGESSMAKLVIAAKKFATKEEGATLVEYALLVGLIAGACFTILTALGRNVQDLFTTVNNAVSTANTTASS
jgi:pilus assembly protein Flp/PilA